MMDNLRRRKEAETNFCNLVGGYKIINEQDVVVRKSKGVKYTPSKLYEKIEELEKALSVSNSWTNFGSSKSLANNV